jgi:NADH dehydrogenase subunit L (EC 1.6.5.3)
VSYLLIGFWYTRPTAVFANMKAFIVNRVGDFGFILGIGLLAAYTGSLNYTEIFAKGPELALLHLPGTDWMLITVACIFCSSAPWARARSSRCMSGCPIRWKARRRFPRSSTPPPW